MSHFDASQVRWSTNRSPWGTDLILTYEGREFLPSSQLPGLRYKYPFRAQGFIIKAEMLPYDFARAGNGQGFGEWKVWQTCPEDLRPMLAPVLCHAWSRTDHPKFPRTGITVTWTAQEWIEGQDNVTKKECAAAETLMRAHGFKVYDGGCRQMRRPANRPDMPIFLDYAHWRCPVGE